MLSSSPKETPVLTVKPPPCFRLAEIVSKTNIWGRNLLENKLNFVFNENQEDFSFSSSTSLPYDKSTSYLKTAIIDFKQLAFVHVSLDPIDAMRSSVQDVATDTIQKGAFTFQVALKDCFNNSIRITDKDNKKQRAKMSVQYSSYAQPQSMEFLKVLDNANNYQR